MKLFVQHAVGKDRLGVFGLRDRLADKIGDDTLHRNPGNGAGIRRGAFGSFRRSRRTFVAATGDRQHRNGRQIGQEEQENALHTDVIIP